jgi:hypothetical protein
VGLCEPPEYPGSTTAVFLGEEKATEVNAAIDFSSWEEDNPERLAHLTTARGSKIGEFFVRNVAKAIREAVEYGKANEARLGLAIEEEWKSLWPEADEGSADVSLRPPVGNWAPPEEEMLVNGGDLQVCDE